MFRGEVSALYLLWEPWGAELKNTYFIWRLVQCKSPCFSLRLFIHPASPTGQPSSYAHTLGSDSKQNLRDDEVLVFLNEDCFKTGSWKQSEITSSQNRLQEQHELVLCFEKSVSKKRKFKVGPNPEHYLARLSNGPVVVEASIIEHQGGGLPSRNSKMPLPRRVLQNSPFCH